MAYSIEAAYLALADGCDAVAPQHREVFLAKLALILADRINDTDQLAKAITIAQQDLADPLN